jgi:hypothetical protein
MATLANNNKTKGPVMVVVVVAEPEPIYAGWGGMAVLVT